MKTCAKCGSTEGRVEFVKDRQGRRPVCRLCDNEQQRENRYKRLGRRRRRGDAYSYTCQSCGLVFESVVSGTSKTTCDDCLRRAFNERARRKWREGYLRRTYGISLEDYEQMLDAQDARCAICSTTEPGGRHDGFVVDHDHSTGAVRSLLCSNCNAAIGLLCEDPAVLRSAIDYLRRHSLRLTV